MAVHRLDITEYDKQKNCGPWYVDRKDVVAFRTVENGSKIYILLRSGDSILVDVSKPNMKFLLDNN